MHDVIMKMQSIIDQPLPDDIMNVLDGPKNLRCELMNEEEVNELRVWKKEAKKIEEKMKEKKINENSDIGILKEMNRLKEIMNNKNDLNKPYDSQSSSFFKRTNEIEPIEIPEILQLKLVALVHGHLTRQLVKTEKVKDLIKNFKETKSVALKLMRESKEGTLHTGDLTLLTTITSELQSILENVHDIFFGISTTDRIRIIRENIINRPTTPNPPLQQKENINIVSSKNLLPCYMTTVDKTSKYDHKRQPNNKRGLVSEATRKSLERRKLLSAVRVPVNHPISKTPINFNMNLNRKVKVNRTDRSLESTYAINVSESKVLKLKR
ncbi:hypothetical protein SNEBB_007352 [Seison nebaliae]|nr:hypothetical protein SNEBB_007352 [Seison nebaliae]